jgi:hypothetical protein
MRSRDAASGSDAANFSSIPDAAWDQWNKAAPMRASACTSGE